MSRMQVEIVFSYEYDPVNYGGLNAEEAAQADQNAMEDDPGMLFEMLGGTVEDLTIKVVPL